MHNSLEKAAPKFEERLIMSDIERILPEDACEEVEIPVEEVREKIGTIVEGHHLKIVGVGPVSTGDNTRARVFFRAHSGKEPQFRYPSGRLHKKA